MAFDNITQEQCAAFLSSLKSGQYNLLLGAGVSMDASNARGDLPSGDAFRKDLCKLKGANENRSLQKVFALLDVSEVKEHVTERFVNCSPGPTLLSLSSFIWKRAFTFNIDDAMEAAYAKPEAKQKLNSLNFDDVYKEVKTMSDLFLIHLHGFVKVPERGYVFSRDEYLQQMVKINPWMTVLSQFISTEPFIIAGSSMDEVDLDYYIANRSITSGREDRGPSILIEPFPDNTTRNECKRHNLVLFEGTSIDFFNFCNDELPNRPTPYELIPIEAQKIVPEGITKQSALAFLADFELVPGTAKKSNEVSRFMYGHPPNWTDLASDLDVSRAITREIVSNIERRLDDPSNDRQLVLLTENTGTGKTTVLRRCAFELARHGVRTLFCTALSRLDSQVTAEIIDHMDDPVVLVVDNFADQVRAFSDILSRLEKKDVVVVAAERSYRIRFVSQVLSGIQYQNFGILDIAPIDVDRLIDNYLKFGLVGLKGGGAKRKQSSKTLALDPIAVVCCRILNDFRPLDRIIAEMLDDCAPVDRDRYLMAALGQYCYRVGINYSVLARAVGGDGLKDQISKDHPLPLAFSDDRSNSYIVPQNATLADRLIKLASENDRERLLQTFVNLANRIAPKVNRLAIMRGTPEARLAGRLFDFDVIVENLLQEHSSAFYVATREAWLWNSRYWGQVAFQKLSMYHRAPDTKEGLEALEMAVQHARHGVSIETHPFTLTTLGKTLLVQMNVDGYSLTSTYAEAFEYLCVAIRLEKKWARMAVQPFITLFRGSSYFLENGGTLSNSQISSLRNLITEANQKFPRDIEVQEKVGALQARL